MVRRFPSLRALLVDVSKLDGKMSSQIDFLLRTLASGIDLAGVGGGDSDEKEMGDDDGVGIGGGLAKRSRVSSTGDSAGGVIEEVAEKDLEEEEARFIGDASGGSGSGEDEVKLSLSVVKKRRASETKALAKAARRREVQSETRRSAVLEMKTWTRGREQQKLDLAVVEIYYRAW